MGKNARKKCEIEYSEECHFNKLVPVLQGGKIHGGLNR